MAQRIIGLDIGSYSLKAVRVDSTFRAFQLVDYKERRVAAVAPEEGVAGPDREAIEGWLADEPGTPETIICSVPGDGVMVRFLTLPFKDRKRIGEVIGFELESHIPYEIDEVVYDYQILSQGDDETRIVCAALPKDRLEGYLATLKEAGVEPKVLSFGAWSYVNLAPYLSPTNGNGEAPPVAIVDMGHRRTEVCVLRGENVEFVRTLDRAGAHLNGVVAERLGIDVHEADRRKRNDGALGVSAAGADDATVQMPAFADDELPGGPPELGPPDLTGPLCEALEEGMADVARDLRLALLAHESETGEGVERVYLCGGTARLPGIHRALEQRLGRPVVPLDTAAFEFNKMSDPRAGAEVIPRGLALSLRGLGSSASSDMNLRRGPYAYEGEFRFLRERLTAIVLMVLALLSIAGFRAYTRYQSLSTQRDRQIEELREVSKELIGRETDDAEFVLQKLRTTSTEVENPFPEVDAFDLFFDITTTLDEVNRMARERASSEEDEEGSEQDKPAEEGAEGEAAEAAAAATPADTGPPDDKYVIELELVRLQKKTGTLKGQANDIVAYELFVSKLKEHRCLRKVETQNTEIVTFKRHRGWREFQLKFNIDCSPRRTARAAKKPAAGGEPDEGGGEPEREE